MRLLVLALLAGPFLPALAAGPLVLPLHFEHDVPVITLPLGSQPLAFTLDTGAPDALYVDTGVEQALPGLRRTGKLVKSMDMGGKVAENHEIAVPDLVLEGMHFAHLGGRTLTPWGLGKDGPNGPPRLSVLGLGFFAGKKVLFDFPAGRVTVWDDSSSVPAEVARWRSVPVERAPEGLLVTLASPAARYRLALDSASTISLVQRSHITATDAAACPAASGGGCAELQVGLAGGARLSLHPAELPARFHADGMVGRAFFDHYRVYLDSAHGDLRVAPVP